MRLLNRVSVVLLDMNGTFMFGHDRFGSEQDFFATYREIGGTRLDERTVQLSVRRCLESLQAAYDSPSAWDSFPSVSDTLLGLGLEPEDSDLIEAIIAKHEIGVVPESHIRFIRNLALTHRVGLVSNLWSRPGIWRKYLEDIGLLSVFSPAVFSSDGGTVKPSTKLFEQALAVLPNRRSEILFAGDSLERDIAPAKELGLLTALVTDSSVDHPCANITVATLEDLARQTRWSL